MSSLFSPTQLEQQLNHLLNAEAFNDYCPNGLQVDAGQPIQKIITGVTACEALIDVAIERQAQAILVHHGYFWKGEVAVLTGMKGKRIRKLMQHGISLLVYHLPLDAHTELGNNAQLAQLLDLIITEPLFPQEKFPIGNIAQAAAPISAHTLFNRLYQTLRRSPLYIAGKNPARYVTDPKIELGNISDTPNLYRIGLCTGGAQDMLEQAALQGCDAFISGEISERTTHIARELGIDYFAAGHHATERGGIHALGSYIAANWDMTVEFVDIDNPA